MYARGFSSYVSDVSCNSEERGDDGKRGNCGMKKEDTSIIIER